MEERYLPYKGKKLRFIINYAKNPEYVVCMVHGKGHYSNDFFELSGLLLKKNVASILLDLPGHGKSEGRKGVVKNFSEYFEVAHMGENLAKELFPNAKIIFLGFSMGGNIVLSSYLENFIKPYKMILLAPWIKLKRKVTWYHMLFAKFLNIFCPSYTISSGLESEYNDPLRHNLLSSGTLLGGIKYGKKMLENSQNVDIPTLLIHSKDDQVIDYIGSEQLADQNQHIQLVSLGKSGHGLLWDVEKEKVLNTIINWI